MLQLRIFCGFALMLLSWQLFEALRTTEIKMRGGGVIRRDEKPELFWFAVASHLPIIGIFLWVVLFAR
jgi:hypothetical protein